MDNKEAFEAPYDKTKLNQTLDFMWMAYPYKFIQKNEDGTCSFDEEGMNAYKAEMKKRKVAKADEICRNVDIALADEHADETQRTLHAAAHRPAVVHEPVLYRLLPWHY